MPFRLFKATLAEGGVRSPLMISGPGVGRHGQIDPALLHVTDLAQAIFAFAGGQGIESLQGRDETRVLGLDLFGQRALISGRWKLLDLPAKQERGYWSLYDLVSDPAEQFDLAPSRQTMVRQLEEQWER